MRILVIGDQHNSETGLKYALALVAEHMPNLIIHLGDIISSRPASFLRETLRCLVATNRPVLVVPGNNDPRDSHHDISESGAINIHERVYERNGYRFVGRGASNPTPFNTVFEEDDQSLAGTIADLVKPGDIWCFHAPVYGFRDRVELQKHMGVRSYWDLLNQVRPWIVLSGHIHDDWGIDYYKGTHFINPGSLQQMRAAILDIDRPKVNVRFLIE
ncbi:metallophosphoesterase family protein [bacterium]|nr:metallophosphoesterase family protein [bacterium]